MSTFTLFVGSLDRSVDERQLEEWFSLYGDVTAVELVRDPTTGASKYYGFVQMLTAEQGQAAIAGLDGAEWMGRQINVAPAARQYDRRAPKRNAPNFEAQRDIYVAGFPFNEAPDDLRELFSSVSSVEVLGVRLSNNDQGLPAGYAFVTVGSAEQAALAIAELNGSQYRGRRLTVAPARQRGQAA
jgi:RNA recognition motif-containing protein